MEDKRVIELRMRSKRSDEWADKYKGAAVNPEMINVKLEGPARVLKPNGQPLCVYLPGAARDIGDSTYEEFSRIRATNYNRGHASGSERQRGGLGRGHDRDTTVVPVTSAVLGSFDPVPGPAPYCRLTAFTAQQVEGWRRLLPYFDRIAVLFEKNVPERYAAQMKEVARTNPDWVIAGTPFTTITVNNTYPTGIHTDKGDLDAGFSALGCIRRGSFTGGWLTFPQYGVAADMQNGDVLLMDAHEWHGNTPIECGHCGEHLRKPGHRCEVLPADEPGPERISVVSYFRTNMVDCGSMAEENERRAQAQERRASKALGLG
jgi:hypothetical protein